MKVKAAVLRERGKPLPYVNSLPLSIEEIELDPPQSGEVLVQIVVFILPSRPLEFLRL